MATDISIEEARAIEWIGDVENELMQVEGILKKVSEALTTVPGEKDDIMNGIVEAGNAMHEFWDKMCDGFKQASSKIGEAIKHIGDTADNVVGDINAVKAKVGS